MSEQFDPNWFDEEFYRRKTGDKGAKRDEQSPNYREFAEKIKQAFGATDVKTVLDIGCGMGWRTLNHLKHGFDATGCDISRWAFQNSVLPRGKHICSNMLDLGNLMTDRYDLVIAERSIEYLPREQLFNALNVLNLISFKYLVFSIVTEDHKDPAVPAMGGPGRKSLLKKAEWEAMFKRFPWKFDYEKTTIMLQNGWDSIWVFKNIGRGIRRGWIG